MARETSTMGGENVTALSSTPLESPRQGSIDIVLDTCCEIAKNVAMGIPAIRRWRLERPRTASRFQGSLNELERYVFFPLRHVRDVTHSVAGLRILEIGPGDHLGSGLAFLAAGAASYTAVDRFPGDYGGCSAREWYRGIRRFWPDVIPGLPWPSDLDPETFPIAADGRVRLLPFAAERLSLAQQPDGAVSKQDVVCSFQVAEHVLDISSFARFSKDLLSPSGIAIHRADFGPHDCWIRYEDKLTFLRFPDWLWSLMGSNRGTPNRYRYDEVRSAFESAGLSVETIEVERLEMPIQRSKLARRFRTMAIESLESMSAIFICRPGASAVSE
jgi:hypothetical protein